MLKSWSETATTIAQEWQRQPGAEFTISDAADVVDVGRRQVKRVLAGFADAGYLDRHDPGEGPANQYRPLDHPGASEADLANAGVDPAAVSSR